MNMKRLLRVSCVCALVLCGLASLANATTISLYNTAADPEFYPGGYSGQADTTLFYYAAPTGDARAPAVYMRGASGANNPTHLLTGGSGTKRLLLGFDLSGMSGQNVVVTSDATVRLRAHAGTAAGQVIKMYEIAGGNAGWTESTKNYVYWPTVGSVANNGDPTWYYKSVDTSLPETTDPSADSSSTKWLSGQVGLGPAGSSPEGYLGLGGLWNEIDLVDQNPATNNYSTPADLEANLDPVATANYPGGTNYMYFTIPASIIQNWIDNPSQNAGLLVRNPSGTTAPITSDDAGTVAAGPNLSFDYEIVPEPSTLSLLGLGLLGFLRRR